MKYTIASIALALSIASAPAQQPTPAAPPPNVLNTQAGSVNVETLTALEHPWGMAFLPDGRLLITEKPGRLRIWSNGQLSQPVSGVPEVDFFEQGGLLDVEIDPDFARNGFVYLSYSEAAAQQSPEAGETGDVRFGPLPLTDKTLKGGAVARGRLSGNRLENVTVIWRQVPKTMARGHFGHRLVFAPDGKLFITSGDRMRFEPAQSLASNLGKVVRINSDGSMPEDNPFGDAKDARRDLWSIGHRNMLGAAINPATGQLWVNEMGPLGGDELNVIVKGKNYGWPEVSNGDNYNGWPIPDHATDRAKKFEAPLRNWTPVISPSGMLFYTGSMFPSWRGSVLMGGLSSMSLIRVTLDGDKATGEERISTGRRIRDVIQAPDGAVLALVDGAKGALLRLTPAN